MDVARQALGPAGGDIPPAQAAQLAQLQARLTALEPELSSARAAAASAKAALDQAQAELRRLETQSQKLERQKAAAGGSLSQQLSARAAGVTEAEQKRVQALAEIARGVLAARGSVAVPEATLQTLRAHDARVEARAVRLETHVRALDSYDHARVRLGIILTLSALGAVVLAIVLKAVL
jgi:chromosome segregation ATPase